MPAHEAVTMSINPGGLGTHPGYKAAWWTPRLAGPVIAAAVVRLALLAVALARVGTSALLSSDTISYLEPGRNLLFHGRFFADGVPDLVRTPGYPLFLAVTSLAGLPMAAVVNVLLSVFSVILVWRLGRAVCDDPRVALGAAWIFAFEPMSVAISVVLLSETLFLALFLLSLERLAEFLRVRRLPVLAMAGVWLAAATFVRPVTYYLPVALALGLFLVLARAPHLSSQRPGGHLAGFSGLLWKAPAVLLISVLPWLAAWQVRNKLETGYSGFSSITDLNAYFFISAEIASHVERRSFSSAVKESGYSEFTNHSGQVYLFPPYLAQHPEQAEWSQSQRLAFMHAEALRVIRAHFGIYRRACLTSLVKTVFNPGAGYFDRLLHPSDPRQSDRLIEEGPVRWGSALIQTDPLVAAEKAVFLMVLLGMYLLAARGVFRAGLHSASMGLLLGTALYFFAVSAAGGGVGADARYRLPVMPIVCVFAAAGCVRTKANARQECAGITAEAR